MLGKARLVISLQQRGKRPTVQSFIGGSVEVMPSARRCFGTRDICIRSRGWLASVAVTLTQTPGDCSHGHLSQVACRLEAVAVKKGVTGSGIHSRTGGGAAQRVSCHLAPSDLVPTEAWWASADQSWQI